MNVISYAIILGSAAALLAATGKELFQEQCSACHAVGASTDPALISLEGVAKSRSPEWLQRIITHPEQLTRDKDSIQLALIKKYDMEMEDLGISPTDALKIIEYLKNPGEPAVEAATPASLPASPSGIAPVADIPQAPALPDPKELRRMGSALFSGRAPFENRGAPCSGCHSFRVSGINGGNYAKDLTGLYGRLGEARLRRALETLKFPVMRHLYADRPLTPVEVAALLSLFSEKAADTAEPGSPFPGAGVGFFALCLGALVVFQKRRP